MHENQPVITVSALHTGGVLAHEFSEVFECVYMFYYLLGAQQSFS